MIREDYETVTSQIKGGIYSVKSRLRLISAVVYNLPFTSPTPQVSEIPKFVDMWFSTMEGIVDGEDAYKKLEQVGKCYSYVHKPIMVGSGVRFIFSVSFYNLPQHVNDLPQVPQPFYAPPPTHSRLASSCGSTPPCGQQSRNVPL